MKIFVQAKPRAKEARVERVDGEHFTVWVTEPPIQGRANQAIIRAIAEYLGVPPSSVKIIQGFTSREKILEIV